MFNHLTKYLTSSINFYQHSINFLSAFQFCKDWKEIRKNRLSFAADSVERRSFITYPPIAKNTVKTKIIKKLFGSYTGNLYLCSRNKDTNNNSNIQLIQTREQLIQQRIRLIMVPY